MRYVVEIGIRLMAAAFGTWLYVSLVTVPWCARNHGDCIPVDAVFVMGTSAVVAIITGVVAADRRDD